MVVYLVFALFMEVRDWVVSSERCLKRNFKKLSTSTGFLRQKWAAFLF
jgi:hypothetical protein